MKLEPYTLGVGDRFARQGLPQLQACLLAARDGVEVIPVWNKSNREHVIIGSEPSGTRAAAEAAVRQLNWSHAYHLDADHIGLKTVDRFIPHCDFYTIDVADSIGKPAPEDAVSRFLSAHPELTAELEIPGLALPIRSTKEQAQQTARKYLLGVQEAGSIYRHIAARRSPDSFVTEVSMDETDRPQTPPELLLILAALSDEKIPLQTVAPKFTGRFNKGVDYVGDLGPFEQEFNDDLAILAFAAKRYGLPETLKLSVHSGSDKFSLYPIIQRALKRFNAGLHIKTAGTTWLEELIGLAESGGEGLVLAKEVYTGARARFDELCAPYATVIDIDSTKLPSASAVSGWSTEQYVSALRHDPGNPEFNPNLRQLLHVGYKVAAEMGNRYLDALDACQTAISRNVTENLYRRHIRPLFANYS
jgi:hypothetical protein